MKLCLVIPGGSATRIAACRIAETLGFSHIGTDGGLYAYEGESGLDMIILDWEEGGDTRLRRRLEILKKENRPIILFCNEGSERDYLERLLGDELGEWHMRPFSMDSLIRTFAH